MASVLHPPLLRIPLSSKPLSHFRTTTPKPHLHLLIRCGPRSNRGPLVKGRVLSTEAILAIQSLKRTQTTSPTDLPRTFSRLIKSDLLAALHELLRQNRFDLALKVFSVVKTEIWYSTDLKLYSDLVMALSREKMMGEIDGLITELETEGKIDLRDKGLSRLIRGLVGAGRKEATVKLYGLMKNSGWGDVESGGVVDEYVGKILSKGLRRFGEVELSKEVDLVLERYRLACLGKEIGV